ncbi:MAG TPA: sulfatase [bacterium]|nr:sulfatase [bacterium]
MTWPLWIALVPWLTLALVEFPFLISEWGFGLSKHGPVGIVAAAAVYVIVGLLTTAVGAVIGRFTSAHNAPGGLGQWLFVWNAGWAWGVLGLGLWIHALLFGMPPGSPLLAFTSAVLGIALAFALAAGFSALAMRHRPVRAAIAVLALPALIAGSIALGPAGGGKPNVLLITIDTCNLSRLSTYGYAQETTPNLTRIAQEGAKFTQAYCHVALTGPSHGSIFTGLAPHAFGVYDNAFPLPFRSQTLAEQFRAHGYFTAGIPGNVVMQERYAFHQGFNRYPQRSAENGLRALQWERLLLFRALRRMWGIEPEAVTPGRLTRLIWGPEARPSIFIHNAVHQNRHALEAVDYAGRQDWFMWLHYFDAHAPYEAHSDNLLQPLLSNSPQLKGLGSINGLFNLSYIGLQPLYGNCFLKQHNVKPVVAAPEEIEDLRRVYDAQLRHIDENLGLLMQQLESRGELDNTLVIVTADHGEALFDRGYFGHSYFLHQDEMHVPLIVWWPDKIPPKVIDTPVALTDLAPTICSLAGVPPIDAWSGPAEQYAGHDLSPWLTGDVPPSHPPVYLMRFDHARGVVTPEGEKLIFQATLGTTPFAVRPWKGDQWLWFNGIADPGETLDLSAGDPRSLPDDTFRRFNQLQGFLDTLARQYDGASVNDINYQAYLIAAASEKEEALMRSIGYLQGTGGGTGTLTEAQCAQPVEYTPAAQAALLEGRMAPVQPPPP